MAHMGNPEPMMEQQEPANLAKRTMIPFELKILIVYRSDVLSQVPDFLIFHKVSTPVCTIIRER